ncbi:MAG: hypothetical protein HY287_03335 [Planctomycetes bacterium]|nr:hypothetical protein [Planctomycetota bacterium]MBI3833345.1 hypothetical protein [Planctomycetota bacterium]
MHAMKRSFVLKLSVFAALITLLSCGASSVLAGSDLGTALDFAGFELFGTHNPLSGGIDFLAAADWQNRRFDAGPQQVTFNGPLSFEVNTGGRPIPRLDVSLETAVGSQGAAVPLNYAYNATFGGKNTTVNGSLLLDTHLGIDAMGFYDIQLRYSSRQLRTVDNHASTTQTRDADLGPINVSGNIVIDALTVLTDPIFQQAGRTNPLDNISGLAKLHDILTAPMAEANSLLSNAGNITQDVNTGSLLSDTLGSLLNAASGNSAANPRSGTLSGAVVPEPPCLAIFLVGAPLVLARGLRVVRNRGKGL